jgi:Mg-chelatase subunit ChlD
MPLTSKLMRAMTLALVCVAGTGHASRDVLLVLDNSGSMRKNDPDRLAPSAVSRFIERQPGDTRVGIVMFADEPELIVPLTQVDSGRGELAAAMDRLNYVGRWTQTAGAIERALYELRLNGRPDAQRAIVLMTDGIIDTGDAKRDAGLYDWLRNSLAPQAAREGVQIYGLAFTERADYQLLQSLAAATSGEYFRALRADDLDGSMRRIDDTLGNIAAPAPAAAPVQAMGAAPAADAAPSRERVVYALPPDEPQPAAAGAGSGGGWWWLLGLTVLAVAGFFAWRARDYLMTLMPKVGAAAKASVHGLTAVLYDVYDPADIKRHEIGDKPVVIGRVSGTDPAMDYVVVDERTVGRWHATIERRGQTFWLRDEGSVNGTFVNDQRISGEHPLKHGDMVRVHRHEFEFVIPELFDSDRTMIGQSQTQLAAADRVDVSA